MTLDFGLLATHAPRLLAGLGWTAALCSAATAAAVVLGFAVAQLRGLHRGAAVAVDAYVSVFRGTPLLVQLFLLYYGGPQLGIVLDPPEAGFLGLALYGGAYYAEIARASSAAVPRGQAEAARALGLGRWQALRFVELPQMLVFAVPPATGQAIVLLKESAVLSIVTVPELTFAATRMATETLSVAEPYLALALLYWAAVSVLARAGRGAEAHLSRHLHVPAARR